MHADPHRGPVLPVRDELEVAAMTAAGAGASPAPGDIDRLDRVQLTMRGTSTMERWMLTCRRELLDRTLIWNQAPYSLNRPPLTSLRSSRVITWMTSSGLAQHRSGR